MIRVEKDGAVSSIPMLTNSSKKASIVTVWPIASMNSLMNNLLSPSRSKTLLLDSRSLFSKPKSLFLISSGTLSSESNLRASSNCFSTDIIPNILSYGSRLESIYDTGSSRAYAMFGWMFSSSSTFELESIGTMLLLPYLMLSSIYSAEELNEATPLKVD